MEHKLDLLASAEDLRVVKIFIAAVIEDVTEDKLADYDLNVQQWDIKALWLARVLRNELLLTIACVQRHDDSKKPCWPIREYPIIENGE